MGFNRLIEILEQLELKYYDAEKNNDLEQMKDLEVRMDATEKKLEIYKTKNA